MPPRPPRRPRRFGRQCKVVTASAPAAPSAPVSAPSNASAWTRPPMASAQARRRSRAAPLRPEGGPAPSRRRSSDRCPVGAPRRRRRPGPDGGVGIAAVNAPRSASRATASAACSAAVPLRTFAGAVVVHQPCPADAGGTPLLAPGSLAQRGGRRHPDPVGRHLGPLRRRDLAGLAEALGHREQGGQARPRPLPCRRRARGSATGPLRRYPCPGRRWRRASRCSWAISGPTWPVSPSRELRPTRTRSNGPSCSQGGGQGPGGGQGVRPGEGRVAQVDAPVRPPGDGFTQDVLGGGRPQGEDGAGPAALPGPFDALGDGAPAVGVHFELDPVPDEPAVVTQRHRLPDRNLLDQGGDPQGPLEAAGRGFIDLDTAVTILGTISGSGRVRPPRSLRLHSGARL